MSPKDNDFYILELGYEEVLGMEDFSALDPSEVDLDSLKSLFDINSVSIALRRSIQKTIQIDKEKKKEPFKSWVYVPLNIAGNEVRVYMQSGIYWKVCEVIARRYQLSEREEKETKIRANSWLKKYARKKLEEEC